MSPRGLFSALAGLAAVLALAAAALSPAPAHAGELSEGCAVLDERAGALCHGPEKFIEAAAAACRYAGVPEEACTLPLAPRVSAAAVDAYQDSWVNRALGLQYELAGDVPLANAPWVGTHNSYNSYAEMGPTLSATDSNQQLSLNDQLRLDVRSLELDAHWFPRLADQGQAPVVCHARGADQRHAGCSVEKPLDEVLGQVSAWLADNRDQVLLLYLEDHLENAEGYGAGAAAVEEKLGDVLYRPPSGGAACDPLPLDLSRDEILASGAQVIIVSDCGAGSAWPAVAHEWSSHVESRPVGFADSPDCGPDYDRATYDSTIVRYYEDSTGLTAGASVLGQASRDEGITPETAAAMARCGVDLIGLDQLLPDDGRLESLVWSWAPEEPGDGACAAQGADGRWSASGCGGRKRVACRSAEGTWSLSRPVKTKRVSDARRACAKLGAVHAAPRTGHENELLEAAVENAGADRVLLGLRNSGGAWTALDPR
jgi:hypothetical protein